MNRDTLPGREIIRELPPVIVTLGKDVDGRPLYYANIHTDPVEFFTSHPGFIYPSPDGLPYAHLGFDAPAQITSEQQHRLDQFLDHSQLPLLLAHHLALNTQEDPINWHSDRPDRQWLVAMVGFSATGKSTLAKTLVETSHCPHVDLELFSHDDENITTYLGLDQSLRPKTICEALTSLAYQMRNSSSDFGLIDGNGFFRFFNKKRTKRPPRPITDLDFLLFGGPEIRILTLPLTKYTNPGKPTLENIADTSLYFFNHHKKSTKKYIPKVFIKEFLRRNDSTIGETMRQKALTVQAHALG